MKFTFELDLYFQISFFNFLISMSTYKIEDFYIDFVHIILQLYVISIFVILKKQNLIKKKNHIKY